MKKEFRFPSIYLPLLILTSLFMAASLWSGTPGTRSRCDIEVVCPYTARGNYDWTFLCCEGATFWPASHIIAPIGVVILLGSPELSAFLVFAWEALEADSLILIAQLVLYPTVESQLERVSGSLVGDAQINGILGILLGMLISSYSGFPGILPFIITNRDGLQTWNSDAIRKKVIWKYFGIFVAYVLCFSIAGHFNATIVYGPYICLAMLAIFLVVTAFFVVEQDDVPSVNMQKTFRRAALPWFLCSFIIWFSSIGFQFLANEWYQAWVLYYASTLFLLAYIRFAFYYRNRASLQKDAK
jgi:hypothetical protein